jgi:predicted alpha/beta-fold hydrolase
VTLNNPLILYRASDGHARELKGILQSTILWAFAFALISPLLSAAPANPFILDPKMDNRHPAAIEELTIISDGARMPGLVYLANGTGPHPTVVLLHGFPGNEKNLDLAQVLRRAGFKVVFFHYRGAWGAEGSYSIRQLDDDTRVVLNFLRQPDNAALSRRHCAPYGAGSLSWG